MASEVIYKLEITADGGRTSKPKAQDESEATEKAIKPESLDFKEGVQKIAGFYAKTALVRTAVKSEVGLMDVYTGNDYQQRVIEGSINVAESALSIATAFFINPVAGIAAVAAKAVSMGADARRKGVELYTQSLEAGMVRERAGGAFNRSRTRGNI